MPLSSGRPARLSRYARKGCLPPGPLVGLLCGVGGARGAVPHANMRDGRWSPPAAGGSQPRGDPQGQDGFTVLSGGIAQRRRDLGREPPRLPRGTKGKESSDMAVRLPALYFWSGSADGSFILLKIKLLLCQMSSLRASKREPEARIRRRG